MSDDVILGARGLAHQTEPIPASVWKQHVKNVLSSMSLTRDLSRKRSVGLIVALLLAVVLFLSPNATVSATTVGFNCTDWDCIPSDGQFLTVASNGTMEVRQSNTACGWSGTYYDSAVRGTPPPIQGGPQGTPLQPGLSSVSVQVKFMSRALNSSSCEEYHLFLSMYYRLSQNVTLYCPADGMTETSNYLDTQVRLDNVNGLDQSQLSSPTYCGRGVGAWGWSNNVLSLSPGQVGTLTANATMQCQQDESAWGISGIPCTLTGVEIGTEGYGFSSLATNWSNIDYTYLTSQPQPNNGGTCSLCNLTSLLSTLTILTVGLTLGGLISVAILLARRKAQHRLSPPTSSILERRGPVRMAIIDATLF